ncbi:DUF600 family protein [Fictibacillus sp. 5RED26]|uniref:immunity protein YezG family protein n=1 Tax=Fictibacillus sp. 5RED26 TaxID=2745876 RepID=UPI0018CED011|nr:immunity protein YezG family protein [Fictibacillus sp. 5RED26]MBH0156653.1 DUF600 family protein [Fictibacillus sp. 5RED26]
METSEIGKIYEAIANKLNEIVPDSWKNIYMYGEVLDDSSEVYFYFSSQTSKELVYGHDIPEIFNVDKKIYKQLLRELLKDVSNLYIGYKENNEEVWTNFTFYLDHTGEFKIEFNYEDILNCPYTSSERQVIWEYEVLHLEPNSERDKELIRKDKKI